ncbi:zinc c2h2 type family protein, putative [Ichthyophthirius multifiliis]|uniref:Zinc c2h2 type family protein, putative n=1 Tax=Ichthyophthirius multifiliis TaxID=5932 RepID=G0R3J9_ICHMU|nr:zinc c2h2 type family protein, putative [Ichthyophthirius multifiliis]EGR27988.1 zinc c2h2 type family protein, putative [Ichthyophthirius multifiliis]|eukprot:XP_004027333.1 zinc c2h2 type family protein, putative [Ichthyophthirius multifiliis]
MEFQNIGRICTVQICHKKNFLPFKCKFCFAPYCQDHFKVDDHGCKQKNNLASKAISCPYCLKTVKYLGSLNENEALDIHQATECNPEDIEKVMKEKKSVFCESEQNFVREICNVCGKSFIDFNELIQHAEQTHYIQG